MSSLRIRLPFISAVSGDRSGARSDRRRSMRTKHGHRPSLGESHGALAEVLEGRELLSGVATHVALLPQPAQAVGAVETRSVGSTSAHAIAASRALAATPHLALYLYRAPSVSDKYYSVAQGKTLVVAAPGVLANSFATAGRTKSAVLYSPPAHGTIRLNANGSFVYTPNASFSGYDSFKFRAYDGRQYSNVGTATIYVVPKPPPSVPTLTVGRSVISYNATLTTTDLNTGVSYQSNELVQLSAPQPKGSTGTGESNPFHLRVFSTSAIARGMLGLNSSSNYVNLRTGQTFVVQAWSIDRVETSDTKNAFSGFLTNDQIPSDNVVYLPVGAGTTPVPWVVSLNTYVSGQLLGTNQVAMTFFGFATNPTDPADVHQISVTLSGSVPGAKVVWP